MSEREKNKKLQDIMHTAHDLFWKHGFRRVSVEEICEKSNVSKMTFYKFFANKFELAKAVLDQVIDEAMLKWDELFKADISATDKIKGIIMLKIEGTNNISREFLEDFYFGSQPELKEFVEQRTAESWSKMYKSIKMAQQKGWFRKDFKPEFLFHVSNKFTEIMNDEKLMSLYDSPQDLIVEFINFVSFGISNPENR